MFKCFTIVLLYTVSVVVARSASGHSFQNIPDESLEQDTASNNLWGDFSLIYNVYKKCSNDDVTTCLKVKLLAGLDKAFSYTKEMKLSEGIKFIKDQDVESDKPYTQPKSEMEIEASLPRSLQDKDETLNSMISEKILSFLQSHTLQIKLPDTNELRRSFDDARGKKGKGGKGALIMIPLLVGGAIIPIMFGLLTLLAGKALIVSKLALVLSSIIGIKKLLSGSGKESQHEVVVSGGHGSSGWGRDIDLAYSSYNPKEKIKIL